MKYPIVVLIILLTLSCRQKPKTDRKESAQEAEVVVVDSIAEGIEKEEAPSVKTFEGLADTTFVRLASKG